MTDRRTFLAGSLATLAIAPRAVAAEPVTRERFPLWPAMPPGADRVSVRDEWGRRSPDGEPDDIAWAAVYLASDEAKFVTGVILPVDGGSSVKVAL